MKTMRSHLLAALVFGSLLGPPAALPARAAETQVSRSEAELLATDAKRYKAMIEGDAATLETLLADELVYVHSSGVRQSKSEHLGDIRAKRARYIKIDVEEQTPHVYGDVGVIHGIAAFKTGGEGAPASRLRYTDVYVKRDGRWQMTVFHCTRIVAVGAPGGAPPPAAVSGGGVSAADYAAIVQLYAEFNTALDLGLGDRFAATWTDDGEFTGGRGPGRGSEPRAPDVRGKAQLRAMARGSGGRHFVTNIVVTPTPEGAKATAYLLLMNARAIPPTVVETAIYDDTLVKTEGGWKFKKRVNWRDDDDISPNKPKALPPAGPPPTAGGAR